MTINVSKCKFMHISRKRNQCPPPSPLSLNGTILDVVPTFKYLGLLISSDLSWSEHIQGVCSKARKLLGLLYRRYYQYSDCSSLRQLYLSLVRPHLDYAAQVWDPHLQRDINTLENGLKLCSMQWDTSYHELLDIFSLPSLPSLKNRRLHLRLCHLFKIINGLCYFLPDALTPNTNHTHFPRPFLLQQPFCRTNSFYHSFIPGTICTWNMLPEHTVCSSTLVSFSDSLSFLTSI